MTQTTPPRRSQPDVYLVVMREVLIAQDLSLTITEFDPTAQVLMAPDMTAGLAMIRTTATLAVAFVEEQPGPFENHDLARAIAARHGRAVLLGEQAEAQGPTRDWDVLRKPFVTDHVLNLLTGRSSGPSLGC